MAKQITTMTDSNGQEVPLKYVGKYNRQRDQVSRWGLSPESVWEDASKAQVPHPTRMSRPLLWDALWYNV